MAKAMAFSSFFLSLVSLYLIIIANGVHSFGEKKTFKVQKMQAKQLLGPMGCLLPESRRQNGAVVLEMKDRGHCSEKKLSWNRRFQKQLVFDDLRVRSMQSQIRKMVSGHTEDDVTETQVPLTSGIVFETLNYVVTIGFGSQNMTVIVDTGSDLTWVQCKPCKSCYNQQGPLFNPSSSSSYQSVLCDSSICQSLQLAIGNSGPCGNNNITACNYEVSYGDGSFSYGELALDYLTFGGVSVRNFVFGCGRNNKGLFGGTSGLMGLGRSKLSMISQTDATFGGVFSYCLPTVEAGASGSLVMGNEFSVFKNVTPIAYTRMVPNPQLPTFYILNLTGINVGDVPLKTPSFGNGGVIIDSGTVITRLAPSVYKALKAEFLKQFSGFPSVPGFSILDTCFNLTGYQEVNIPTIRIYFEDNVELNVDVNGIFYMVKEDASQVCLALASLSSEYETGIIGNYQQRNQRVVYDTKQSKVGFAGESCGFI
ncbi:aspartyl protease family protein [Senna tora]|uniref:Aspartyl protease family protein n=1 Tax=Senna tora TaxID=362788 RepID=A0A834XDD4_9FABA|nr:aspartyl protease family protein [Senna tora]